MDLAPPRLQEACRPNALATGNQNGCTVYTLQMVRVGVGKGGRRGEELSLGFAAEAFWPPCFSQEQLNF